MQAAFGAPLTTLYSEQFVLSVASPADGCSPFTNAAGVNASVVIIQRGNCFMSTKVGSACSQLMPGFRLNCPGIHLAWTCLQVANAQLAGARAAIVYDNKIDDYFLMLANDSSAASILIPGLSIPRKVGTLLISSIQVGPRKTVKAFN